MVLGALTTGLYTFRMFYLVALGKPRRRSATMVRFWLPMAETTALEFDMRYGMLRGPDTPAALRRE